MEGAMAQLSRPFQIALLAVGLLAAAWFFALRGHQTSTGSSSATAPSSSAPSASSQPPQAAAPTPVYHGPAPGLEGLTRAIARAHAAVAASQRRAQQVEKAARAPSPTSAGAASGASTTGSGAASKGASATHPATGNPATAHKGTSSGTRAPAHGSGPTASPIMQATVEGELKQGKVVTILFWNPESSVDAAVQRELQAAVRSSGGKVTVHDAHADQVGSFGSITHAVQVFQTPTILIVNKRGRTTVLMGLTDVFALTQAIDEARHA